MTAVMAAAPPPTSPPTDPALRRPMSLASRPSGMPREPISLSSAALSESPRLKQPPVSPVHVNFQPENWAMPASAEVVRHGHDRDRDQALSVSPTPPTPPPHKSQAMGSPASTIQRPAPVAAGATSRTRPLEGRPLLPLHFYHSASDASSDKEFSREFRSGPWALGRNSTIETESSANSHRDSHDSRESRESRIANTMAGGSDQQPAGANDVSGVDGTADSAGLWLKSSLDDAFDSEQPVPQLQYHHQSFMPPSASTPAILPHGIELRDTRSFSNPDLVRRESPINRHLTPSSVDLRRSSMPRPMSTYSAYSELDPRSRSPASYGSHPRKSPDSRPVSYADMLNVPYPQPAPAPISLDNGQLRNVVGSNASLLSTQQTLEMYRQNVKKTNDMSIQYSFAVFLISTAQEQGFTPEELAKGKASPKPTRDRDSLDVERGTGSPHDLVREARSILQRLSNAGYPFAQYYLADGYASGLFSKGKEDYGTAFPLFVLAAKHGHAESAYRTALCYEFGWGCRKDPTRAIQYLRTAASKHHPGAMTRLAKACLSGDLGEKRYKEGVKWMKLATEAADTIYNGAPYQLGCMYETGYGDDVFKDESYAAELFTQAAELGHPDANYRMGDAYEHGSLNCPRDPALSVHFYTGAAERGHPGAMMGLCAWYLVGAEPMLEKDTEEAYEWARRAAELGYAKAQYTVAYFTEMGIGCRRDILEANVWYVKAADAGEERAKKRLAAIRAAAGGSMPVDDEPAPSGKLKKHGNKDENCSIM